MNKKLKKTISVILLVVLVEGFLVLFALFMAGMNGSTNLHYYCNETNRLSNRVPDNMKKWLPQPDATDSEGKPEIIDVCFTKTFSDYMTNDDGVKYIETGSSGYGSPEAKLNTFLLLSNDVVYAKGVFKKDGLSSIISVMTPEVTDNHVAYYDARVLDEYRGYKIYGYLKSNGVYEVMIIADEDGYGAQLYGDELKYKYLMEYPGEERDALPAEKKNELILKAMRDCIDYVEDR